MKKYSLVKKLDNTYSRRNIVKIYNEDENPIIKSILCTVFSGDDPGRQVKIEFGDVTQEMRDRFRGVSYLAREYGKEYANLINQYEMDKIIAFFKVISEIDPVPFDAFTKMKSLIDFDLTVFLNHDLIEQKMLEGEHEGALQVALDSDSSGNSDALPFLANLYEKNPSPAPAYASDERKEDSRPSLDEAEAAATALPRAHRHLINLFEHYPKNHPLFVRANEQLHEILPTLSN